MRASVIGATGFAGVELVRLLLGHPKAEIAMVTSESSTGELLNKMYPHLKNRFDKSLTSMQDLQGIAEASDVIFLALPHGHAMKIAKELKNSDVKIIDLGGDYRFQDPKVFEKWYKVEHLDPTTRAVYGLVELYRDKIKGSKLVANPGCYTTSSILALVPLLKNKLVKTKGIIVDAKSGTTGAGRSLKLGSLYESVNESFKAYGVASHRHTPEIEQAYSDFAGEDVIIQFTPHLLPCDRGIYATCYADLADNVTDEAVAEAFASMYGGEYFIRLLGKGVMPELKNIRASNYVDIGWEIDRRTNRVIVVSCLDNLVKGAAGQAIQNMNVLFDLPEQMGLEALPIYP
ncbi:MAG: N-acetyl-gamma-glutamyl-phosphate reductase [Acidaminococcaceae bacterium]|nr:N-acetyl-gamma-glutamyl-phosphate reductase [Acidaminococcaceae bacterium]MDO4935600.1 N-acetyl-gamma-glutamyl-phosphate reductase [Phascolarctobacterium sp.]